MKRRTSRKSSKEKLAECRVRRAYETAAQVVLFMSIDKKPVAVQIISEPYFYSCSYTSTDFRLLVVATVGALSAPVLRISGEAESDKVYNELLALDDPNNMFDKITEEETRNLVTLGLNLMVKNWHFVDGINQAARLC